MEPRARPGATVIGLDVGGSKTAIVEGTPDAEILQRDELSTDATRPFRQTFPGIAEKLDRTIANALAASRHPVALSVSVGGPLRIQEGILLDPPHLRGWRGVALKGVLAERYPRLPVYVEHDGNAGALAEYHFGFGRGRRDLQHLVFLTMGTGLGAGLIVNGRVVHGASDTAGEVGHIRVAKTGPVGYGKEGSWEGLASGVGLVNLASTMFPHRWGPESRVKDVVEAILTDDRDALAVAEGLGEWLGRGMAILIDVLNPQVIVLGTLGVLLGDRILQPARRIIRQEALATASAACEIVPALLGNRLGDVSALMAALCSPEVNRVLKGQAS